MYKVIVTTAKGKTSFYKTKRSTDVLFGETGYCLRACKKQTKRHLYKLCLY